MILEHEVKSLKQDIEAVINEAMKCKLDVYEKINTFEDALEIASTDRANYNLMLNQKIDKISEVQADLVKSHISMKEWFMKHDEKEMEKFQQHTDAINELTNTIKEITKKTLAHSSYIQSEEYNKKLESMVQRRLDEENKPKADMIYKAKMTAITIVTGAILYGAYYGVKFVYDLSIKLGG